MGGWPNITYDQGGGNDGGEGVDRGDEGDGGVQRRRRRGRRKVRKEGGEDVTMAGQPMKKER